MDQCYIYVNLPLIVTAHLHIPSILHTLVKQVIYFFYNLKDFKMLFLLTLIGKHPEFGD